MRCQAGGQALDLFELQNRGDLGYQTLFWEANEARHFSASLENLTAMLSVNSQYKEN